VYWETPLYPFVFFGSYYYNATLYGTKAAYEATDVWKEFKEIVEFEAEKDGIDAVMSDREGIKSIYSLGGQRLNKPQRGLNIIRSANGRLQGKKIRKVLVK
jgi:uncharacterized protein (UPF0264 family)